MNKKGGVAPFFNNRLDSYHTHPERLGALDYGVIEAEYALRAQACGDSEVKRIARP